MELRDLARDLASFVELPQLVMNISNIPLLLMMLFFMKEGKNVYKDYF